MKKTKLYLHLLLLFAVSGASRSLGAAGYATAANSLAEDFLVQKESGETTFVAFLKDQGIGDGDILTACKAALARAEALVKAGAQPGKPAFALLMASTGPKEDGAQSGRSKTAPKGKKDEEPPATAGKKEPTETNPLMGKLAEVVEGHNVFFHSGVRVLTPYKLDYATRKISSDSTTTGGFLEIVASNIWTWQPGYLKQSWKGYDREYEKKHGVGLEDFDWQPLFAGDFDEGWDYLARLSFDFGADSEASAATITGSGDVGAEVSVTKHLARGWTPRGAWSVGPGISIGMVTDRQARQVHPSFFAGINTAASFLVGENENRLALLRVGFGWAKVDGIAYDDPAQDTIRFDGNVPDYEAKWRPAAEAELWWPMGEGGQLTAGARIYGHPQHSASRLDQWTLYLGAQLDIPSALGALNPARKGKPGKAGEQE